MVAVPPRQFAGGNKRVEGRSQARPQLNLGHHRPVALINSTQEAVLVKKMNGSRLKYYLIPRSTYMPAHHLGLGCRVVDPRQKLPQARHGLL